MERFAIVNSFGRHQLLIWNALIAVTPCRCIIVPVARAAVDRSVVREELLIWIKVIVTFIRLTNSKCEK